MSRVCIVVLEEVEDESPTFISKLPQENKSLHPPPGNVLVRYESLYVYYILLNYCKFYLKSKHKLVPTNFIKNQFNAMMCINL